MSICPLFETNFSSENKCPVLEHFDIINKIVIRQKIGHENNDVVNDVLKYYDPSKSTSGKYILKNEYRSKVLDFSEHFDKIGGNLLKLKQGHETTDLTEVLKYYDKIGSNNLFQANYDK